MTVVQDTGKSRSNHRSGSRNRRVAAALLLLLGPFALSLSALANQAATDTFDPAVDTPLIGTIGIIQDHGMLGPNLPHLGENEDQGGQLVYELDKGRALAKMGYHVVIFARKTKDSRYPKMREKDYVEQIGKGKLEIRYVPFGPPGKNQLKFTSKYELWPYLGNFAEGIAANVLKSRLKIDFLMGAYAVGNQAAAMVSSILSDASEGARRRGGKKSALMQHYKNGVPYSWTPHSTGAKKYDAARTNNFERPVQLDRHYRYTPRRAAEAESLKRAAIVTAGSQDEVDGYGHHWYSASLRTKDPHKDPRLIVMKQGIGDVFDRKRPFTKDDREMAQEFHDSWRKQIPPARHRKPALWFWSRFNEKKNPSGMLWEYAHRPDLQARYNLVIANPDDPKCAEAQLIHRLLDVLETKIPGIKEKVAVVPIKEQKHLNSTQVGLSAMGRSIIRYDWASGQVGMKPRMLRDASNQWEYINPAQIEPAGRMNFEFGYAGCHTASTNEGGPRNLVINGNPTDKGYPHESGGLLFVPPFHPSDPRGIEIKDHSLSPRQKLEQKYAALVRDHATYGESNRAGQSTFGSVMSNWARQVELDRGLYDRSVDVAYNQVKRDMQWSVNLRPLLKRMNQIRETGSWVPVKRSDVSAWFWNPTWRNRDRLGDKHPALDDTMWHRISRALDDPRSSRDLARKVHGALVRSKVSDPGELRDRRLLEEVPGATLAGEMALKKLARTGKRTATVHFSNVVGMTGAESGSDTSKPHERFFGIEHRPGKNTAPQGEEPRGGLVFGGTVRATRRENAQGQEVLSFRVLEATATRHPTPAGKIASVRLNGRRGSGWPVASVAESGRLRNAEEVAAAPQVRRLPERNGHSGPGGSRSTRTRP